MVVHDCDDTDIFRGVLELHCKRSRCLLGLPTELIGPSVFLNVVK